jgi:hypothetical protein
VSTSNSHVGLPAVNVETLGGEGLQEISHEGGAVRYRTLAI